MPLQRLEQPGGAPLPRRPAPPGDGVRAGPEPQPPAGHHGRQPADDQARAGAPAGCQGLPPPAPIPRMAATRQGRVRVQAAHSAARIRRHLRLGGAARPAHAGPHPHRHHRPVRAGAGQQLVGVVAEVGEDGLQVGLAERPHRPAGPVIVVEGEPVG